MRRALMACTLAAIALGVPSDNAYAQTSTPPDQIQEDWQVVIGVPDPSNAGPQISTYLSPVSDGSTPFFIFDLNYQDSPTFTAGGMQVQVWSGDTLVSGATKGTAQLSTTNETITWTSVMSISSTTGTVSFGINSGRSTTWGKFGQGQQLNINGSFTTSLTSLSNYSPATSVANAGVGWESNRVTSMTLLRVRYYAGGKLLSTDNTARSVSLSN
jgi:hypothetical protein